MPLGSVTTVNDCQSPITPALGVTSTAFWNVQADLEWHCSSGETIRAPAKIYLVMFEATGYAAGFDLFHGRGPEGCRKKT